MIMKRVTLTVDVTDVAARAIERDGLNGAISLRALSTVAFQGYQILKVDDLPPRYTAESWPGLESTIADLVRVEFDTRKEQLLWAVEQLKRGRSVRCSEE
jgi:hypothetical protein